MCVMRFNEANLTHEKCASRYSDLMDPAPPGKQHDKSCNFGEL